MKFLRYFLFVTFLFNNSHCCATSLSGNVEFATGEEYWEQSKLHYHLSVANQFRERHANHVEMDVFRSILEWDQKNTLDASINFTLNMFLSDVKLNFDVHKAGSTQLQLFLAFNEAITEIFDTGSNIYTKAKYIRSDLNKAKDYFAQVVSFLNGVQHISQYIFNGVDNHFDEENFIKSLNNASYIPAESIQRQTDSFIDDAKTKQQGVISLEQYIQFFTDLYSKLFTNQYLFLKAHLISQSPKTRLNLNRKMTGGLNEFEYNLTTINLLKTTKPEIKKEDTASVVQVNTNEADLVIKHKKKRKKKGGQSQILLEAPQTIDELSSTSSTSMASEAETTKVKSDMKEDDETSSSSTSTAFQVNNNEGDLVTNNKKKRKKKKAQTNTATTEELSSTSTTSAVNFLNNQKFDEPLPQQISEEEILSNSSSSIQETSLLVMPTVQEKNISVRKVDTKEKVTRKQKGQPINVAQKISHMQKLNNLLDEYDGGPVAGMKTRKFLRLCTSLHENGFFSGFSANQKEVHVKLDGMVSVMHVENHSANRKSPGVSRNTAKKLHEIIDIIKNSKPSGE